MCVLIVLHHLLHVLMPVNTTAIELLNYGKDLPLIPFCRPVRLLVGMKSKDTTKPKIRKRKDLLVVASEETSEMFPKTVYLPTAKLGKF